MSERFTGRPEDELCAALKPLPFRGGVGVGTVSIAQGWKRPTPLRLASMLASLTTPPLKRRGGI